MSSTAPSVAQEPTLLREDRNGVTTLTLNRPSQYNALSEALLADLQGALDAIAQDPAVRVVVVAAAGKGFCAGHDLKEMRANPSRGYYEDLFARSSHVMKSIATLPKPVIARVHGMATAAGCQLVAACDLAVASNTARFAVCGVNLGLFCSTPGVALGRNVSRKRAFEMLITGDFIDADTAARFGLVNRVAAPDALDAEIATLTDSILAKPAVAIETGKRMFYKQLEMDLDAAYAFAGDMMACNMMAEDTTEGIDAFMEKRTPKWG